MANYSKTQELFDRELNRVPSLKYEKSGEQLSEEKLFAQVKNPNSGEFFQLEDLRAVGAVPGDFGIDEKPKKYPVKKIDEIIRIKKADGTEWLISRQTWVGLDRLGNDMTKCFVDPELYDKPVFNYQSKPVNPRDAFSKIERKAVSVMYVKEPTVPFTLKNFSTYHPTYGEPRYRSNL